MAELGWHTIEESGENWRREPESCPSIDVIEPASKERRKGNAVAFGFSRVLEGGGKKPKKKKKARKRGTS